MAWKGEKRRHQLAARGMQTSIDLYGLADRENVTRRDVNPKQLRIGIEIEMEHTQDPQVAEQIALDHLTEYPNYYTALLKMEEELESHKEFLEEITNEYLSRKHGSGVLPYYQEKYADDPLYAARKLTPIVMKEAMKTYYADDIKDAHKFLVEKGVIEQDSFDGKDNMPIINTAKEEGWKRKDIPAGFMFAGNYKQFYRDASRGDI